MKTRRPTPPSGYGNRVTEIEIVPLDKGLRRLKAKGGKRNFRLNVFFFCFFFSFFFLYKGKLCDSKPK